MPTGPVVESSDVLKDREARFLARVIAMLVDQLGLEGVEEALGDGVVETAAGPTGAGHQPMPLDELLDPKREKWSAAIGVKDESGRRPPLRQGHREGLVRERLVQQGRHRPTDNAAGVEIEHDGQMEPALAGAD